MSDNKFDYKYRIDLDAYELDILSQYIKEIKEEDVNAIELPTFNEIKQKIANPKKIKHSWKKIYATEKATEARSKKVKEKINNAINILRMENKEITPYQVAKVSGVSFVTVKKYLVV